MKTATASDLGIEIADANGVFRWLLASFLMGKRIRSTVAIKAYKILVDQQGLDTPSKLAQKPHFPLVRILGLAGYARYDESTARRLRALGNRLDEQLDDQLGRLKDGTQSLDGFISWVLSFDGVGPKTVEIFMREAASYLSP